MKTIKFISVLFTFLLLIHSTFAFGKKDSSENSASSAPEKKVEIQKGHINIDLFLDTKGANPKNHFNWNTTSSKYKDHFDAVSGASKFHSTKYLRETVLDKDAKDFKIPKGLYCLCLFAVANPDSLKTDEFKITSEGKKLTITFHHRGINYKIESNEKGEFLVPGSFYIKQEPKKDEATAKEGKEQKPQKSEEKAEPKAQDSKEESEKPEETIPEDGFILDEGSETLKAVYKGKLKANLTPEGILTIKGKLDHSAREEKKAEDAKPEEEKN